MRTLSLILSLAFLSCSAPDRNQLSLPDGQPPADAHPAPDTPSDLSRDDHAGPDVPVDPPPRCGDGRCQRSESCGTCPMDCGACPARCGDGMCTGPETCTTCPMDCGACPPRCGDGMCTGPETCANCPRDCGACDPCASGTTCATCTARGPCGWCSNVMRCLSGNASGPGNRACEGAEWRWMPTACLVPDP